MEDKYLLHDKQELEIEQSMLRLAVVSIIYVYVIILTLNELIPGGFFGNKFILIGLVYTAISLVIYLFARVNKGSPNIRRITGMVLDILLTSIFIYSLKEYGVPIFVVYLWLSMGNGFRYGARYLIFCTILSIAGFLAGVYVGDYWSNYAPFVVTGIILLVLIPAYASFLLMRLEAEKIKSQLANKEKTRFLANISHEIRTPLNAVVGFSSLLDKVDDPDKKEHLIRRINDSAESLVALVDGVLEFSRIESGHVVINKEPVEIQSLIHAVQGMFSLQADRKGITLKYSISPEIANYVEGDLLRLRQVLVNLVGNAVKFTEKGEVSINVILSGNEDVLHFDIRDTGIGIPKNLQASIFERFRQVDDSAQRKYGGTGLGTAISKNLVELMGGKIGLESTIGEGSRFWFEIPYITLWTDMPVTKSSKYSAAKTNESNDSVQNIKILVVEDSKINQEVYRGMFDHLGLEARYASTGLHALDLLDNEKFDLMILDIQMPGMSGMEVIENYRKSLNGETSVPIAVITGDATSDIQEECTKLGINYFLTKPVYIERLEEIIRDIT